MKSNKYVPVGMLFLILAIILNVVSNVSDMVLGILYGISIAVLIIGLSNSRKQVLQLRKGAEGLPGLAAQLGVAAEVNYKQPRRYIMKSISFQGIGAFILVFSLSCLFLTVIQGMGNLCSPNVLMISLGMGLVSATIYFFAFRNHDQSTVLS